MCVGTLQEVLLLLCCTKSAWHWRCFCCVPRPAHAPLTACNRPVAAFLIILQEFLSGFSRLLVSQLAPEIPEQRVQVAVTELLGSVGANTPKPVDVRLEFKHVCKCVRCRNSSSVSRSNCSDSTAVQGYVAVRVRLSCANAGSGSMLWQRNGSS